MKFTSTGLTKKKTELLPILEERRLTKLKANLKEHDNAFLNSLLSHAVYTGRQWTLELIKNHPSNILNKDNAREKLESLIKDSSLDLTNRRAYEIYMSTYLRNTFELVDLPIKSEVYHSKKFGYSTQINFKHGDYEALDNLARAGIFRSFNSDGSYTLHIAFRGTDTGARPFSDFVTIAYTDVMSYSDCFQPLEKALIEYVSNPDNKISNVHLSGHSLGGAPAQIMLENLENNNEFTKTNIKINGYTYGSIGGTSYFWNKLLSAPYHLIKHSNLQSLKDLSSFKLIGLSIIKDKIHNFLFKENSHPNIYRYKHSGDLIPKIGSIGYNNHGITHELKDYCGQNSHAETSIGGKKIYCSQDIEFKNLPLITKIKLNFIDAPINNFKKIFTLGYHDMLRYIRNVDSHIKNIIEGNSSLSHLNLTPRFNEFKKYNERFNKATSIHNDAITQRIFTNNNQVGTSHRISHIERYKELNLIVQKMKSLRNVSQLSEDLLKDFSPLSNKI